MNGLLLYILPVAILGGFFVGSFLNVLADRLPVGENVLWGRSHCDACKKTLRWFELIPLLSFLAVSGRCLRCHTKLSWEYPAVEALTGLAYGLIVASFFFSNPWYCASLLIVTSALIVIFVADLKYFIIPDSMIVVALLGTLVVLIPQSPTVWINHIFTAVISGCFFYALWYGTKKKGLGFGDVKFSFLMGFFLGFPQIITAMYVAFLTGAGLGVILILGHKKSLKSRVPFGPFLILGFFTALFISLPKLIGL